jgi:DNA-binding transcriptional regulator YdaS (Cro superfamily)
MANSSGNDGHTELELASSEQFGAISESVGAKRLAQALGISPRQVNRILSGAQPNPIERFILCLQAVEPAVGDQALDFVCREMGGHFVRHVSADQSITEAVRECAEAIAVMSDGSLTDPDIKEIREAISALSSVLLEVNHKSS